ncbi:MAG: hypothetical protein BECKG1743D_GA0114223_106482 [Candidatus Kentron sp. G]|nr:MAG: hypothetical protein BECKG1743F_GA0114225_107433 [Candidatus Kentron sp. G]VFN04560.1 MAG: hypothetical protein BECKG1743E_GA0114224_107463 [Candidatus Kentron sp. G]VFN04920.1 MAG: hypothetical protein BECKG1743D_GA0114223_106482 [Candidatus Kentron sp. G]
MPRALPATKVEPTQRRAGLRSRPPCEKYLLPVRPAQVLAGSNMRYFSFLPIALSEMLRQAFEINRMRSTPLGFQ